MAEQQSITAEGFSIGYMMMYPELIDETVISLDLYLSPVHQALVEALFFLSKNKQKIDTLSVLSRCKDVVLTYYNSEQELLKYIGDIYNYLPIDFNFENAVYILKEIRDKRELQQAGASIEKLSSEYNISAEEIIDEAKKTLDTIEKRMIPLEQTSFTTGELMSAYCNHLNAELEAIYNKNAKKKRLRLKFGINSLDEKLYFEKKQFMILGADPGVGKTSFCIQIIRNMLEAGQTVLMFSFEMEKEALAVKIVANITGIPINTLQCRDGKHPTDHQIEAIINPAMAWADTLKLHVERPYVAWTAAKIVKVIQGYKKKGIHPDLVIIDHLGLLAYKGTTDAERGIEYGDAVTLIRNAAVDMEFGVIALQHLKDEARPGKMPTGNDLAGGKKQTRNADIILTMIRPGFVTDGEPLDKVTGFIAKCRDGFAFSRFNMRFLQEYSAFKDWD